MDMEDFEIEEDDQTPQVEPPVKQEVTENGGYRIFLIGVCALIIGLAIPLVFFFFVESPQPAEHIRFFGFSYYRLLFILFLTAGTMVYTSFFFLNLKPVSILFFFCLILFCCFPFIIGLKKDLTLSQVILSIPFFAGWPIFLNPGYMLIEFLIPLGILIYLFLQVKNTFSRPPHHYTFLCVAAYLSMATFLGLSGLAQANQPTIRSAIVKLIEAKPSRRNTNTDYRKMPQDFVYPDKQRPIEADASSISLPPVPMVSDIETPGPATTAPETGNIDGRFLRLSEKMDGLQTQLDTLETFLLNQQTGALQSATTIEAKEATQLRGDKEALLNIQEEMKRLSERLDLISSTFNKLALLLNFAEEAPIENRNGSVIEQPSVPVPKDTPQQ